MASVLTPTTKWAQRDDSVHVSIEVPDVKPGHTIKVEGDPAKLYFDGIGGTESRHYHLEIELFAPLSAEDCKYVVRPRQVEFSLAKKNAEDKWWPRLQKEEKKPFFIKVDFNRWVDEDEKDEANEIDTSGMAGMPGMGGMGEGGMPDLSALQGMAGMGGGQGGMPDLSALQGMAGMGGQGGGMPDLSAMGGMGGDNKFDFSQMKMPSNPTPATGDSDDESDDDLPDLEPANKKE